MLTTARRLPPFLPPCPIPPSPFPSFSPSTNQEALFHGSSITGEGGRERRGWNRTPMNDIEVRGKGWNDAQLRQKSGMFSNTLVSHKIKLNILENFYVFYSCMNLQIQQPISPGRGICFRLVRAGSLFNSGRSGANFSKSLFSPLIPPIKNLYGIRLTLSQKIEAPFPSRAPKEVCPMFISRKKSFPYTTFLLPGR